MKIKDLVKALSALNQNLEVICYCEDQDTELTGSASTVFEIDHIAVADVVLSRVDDRPAMTFGKTPRSVQVAVVQLLSDV